MIMTQKNFKIFAVLLLTILCSGIRLRAQIYITPSITEEIKFENPANAKLIERRLRDAISKSNIVSTDENSRFIISVDLIPESENYTSTIPTKVALVLGVQLTIGDYLTGQRFAVETIRAKGVGNTSQNAIQNAIQNAFRQQNVITSLIATGKQRIIDYYNQNTDNIIQTASNRASQGDYDEALYFLALIPIESNGYNKVQPYIEEIYNQRQHYIANETLLKARAAWERGHNKEAAGEALELLASIPPHSSLSKNVDKLTSEIQKSISTQEAMQAEEERLNNAHERSMEKMELRGRLAHQKQIDLANQTKIEQDAKLASQLIQANRDIEIAHTKKEIEAISAAKEIAREYVKSHQTRVIINRHFWH